MAARRNGRRRIALGAGVVLVLACVSLSEWLGWPYLRAPIASIASRVLEREVVITKPFSLHLLASPTLDAGRISIAAPAWSDAPAFAVLEGLSVQTGWRELLRGRVELKRVALARGEVWAQRRADGVATWSFASREQPAPSERIEADRTVRVGDVSVGRVSVHIDDAVQRLALDVDLEETDGSGESPAIVATGRGSFDGTPLDVRLQVPVWRRALESRQIGDAALEARLGETRLVFHGEAEGLPSLERVAGRIEVSGASLADVGRVSGLTLPSTRAFEIKGRLERDGQRVHVQTDSARIGGSSFAVRLDYDASSDPPRLSGEMSSERLLLRDLGASLGGSVSADGAARTARAQAKVFASDEFDLPSLGRMNAAISIDLRRLDLGASALRPLTRVRARLSLENGVLALADLEADLASGKVRGETSLDASDPASTTRWKANLDWKGVDLEYWIRASEGEHFVAGRFSGRTELAGAGRSTASILGSIEGSIRGGITGGSISHLIVEAADLDAAQALGVYFDGEKPLALSCALIDLRVSEGVMKPSLVLLNTKDSVMFVEGTADLKKEVLNLRLVPAPKDWSLFSLAAPITLTGTFARPSLGVEPVPIALKVVSAIVLGAITPIAAVLPFIDAPDTGASDGCGPAVKAVRENAKQAQAAGGEREAVRDKGLARARSQRAPPPGHPGMSRP